MLRRTAVGLVIVATIVAGAWLQQALSEENAPTPPAPGQRDPEQMRQRMEQFRQQMADRMKQELGVNDEEWKVLQPKIEKVQTLARQSRGGGMGPMGGFGRRGPRPGAEADANRPLQTELDKKVAELRKILENKEAKPEEIKPALAALREVRAKAKAELEAAQKELRDIITVGQEARLVLMGVLD
jgi:hypothetical protein